MFLDLAVEFFPGADQVDEGVLLVALFVSLM